MRRLHLRRSEFARAVSAAAAGMLLTESASTQDLRVTVTGSNIPRTDAETAAPVQTITRADIEASGLQTISDVLRQITANNNGSISPSFTQGFSSSGSAVSLRGLGPNNTLVLLNGRRLANFGLADDAHISYVDLQQIPFEAVERIEVLKDGASAIYGSDAVAGVVNVILRQQFTGVSATATAGTTYNGDGNQYKGAVTLGIGDITRDRFNVFATVDAQRQEATPANRGRAYTGTNDLRFMGLPDGRFGNPASNPASVLGNVRPVSAGNPTGPPTGPFQPLPGACPPSDQDGPWCRWESKDYFDASPEVERFNAFLRAAYAVSDTVEAYAELSYFRVETDTRTGLSFSRQRWADPSNDTSKNSQTIHLPLGHPDNPFNARGDVARLFYADAALGPRQGSYATETQRYLVGARGSAIGWDWDLAGLYIRSDTTITRRHFYQYDRLLQGLAGTGPYGYYRIGASAPLNDPAIYAWIAPDLTYGTRSTNTSFDAKASRDVYRLPGGQMALAMGYEFRREELNNPGVPGTYTGNIVGIGYSSAGGSRNVNAVYAELFAPLLKTLETTVAARVDHYSDFGTTTNPKVGIKWTPLPQVALRGTWETAFRAPGLYEIGTGTGAGFLAVNDPVRCAKPDKPPDCGSPVVVFAPGNPTLQPETSTTYTAGVVWEPAPGFSATVDYWNISVRQQIGGPPTQAVVQDPTRYPTARIERDTNDLPGIPNSGSILSISNPWQNIDCVKTSGIDVDVVWRFASVQWGTLTTELQWTHVFNYTQTLANGQRFEYAGTQGNYDVSSGAGTPQDRANLILGWQRGPWNVTGTVRYVSDYQSVYWRGDVTDEGAPNCIAPPLDGLDCHVASFTTLDLSASYSGFKNWRIFGSVINVFNRLAPFNPAAGYGGVNYNYNYAFSGVTGTQFNLGARYTFQ